MHCKSGCFSSCRFDFVLDRNCSFACWIWLLWNFFLDIGLLFLSIQLPCSTRNSKAAPSDVKMPSSRTLWKASKRNGQNYQLVGPKLLIDHINTNKMIDLGAFHLRWLRPPPWGNGSSWWGNLSNKQNYVFIICAWNLIAVSFCRSNFDQYQAKFYVLGPNSNLKCRNQRISNWKKNINFCSILVEIWRTK